SSRHLNECHGGPSAVIREGVHPAVGSMTVASPPRRRDDEIAEELAAHDPGSLLAVRFGAHPLGHVVHELAELDPTAAVAIRRLPGQRLEERGGEEAVARRRGRGDARRLTLPRELEPARTAALVARRRHLVAELRAARGGEDEHARAIFPREGA